MLDLFRQEQTVENKETFIYTEEQLMARLKFFIGIDRKSTRLNSSHSQQSRMPSSA